MIVRAEPRVEGVDNERVLIDAAVAGVVEAFASLYDLYVERVYRHAYYRVGNRADAEDVTQQVFLQAWQAIGRYRPTGVSFGAWLLTISHNLIVNFHRRVKPGNLLHSDPIAGERWTDPEFEAFANHDRLALRRSILRLKPEQQQVIVMRFINGFEYSEIAAGLQKSEGNIRVIQHRALAELRRLLTHEVKV